MTINQTFFGGTRRFWVTTIICAVLILLLTGCADIDTLWQEVDNAIANADCEEARQPLNVLKNNEERLDEANRTKLSNLDAACSNLASANKRLNRDDHALGARYYEQALKSLEPQTPLYKLVAAQITELYDTAPLDSLLDHCNGVTDHYTYHVLFFEAGLIDEDTYKEAELTCTNLIVERIVRANDRLVDAPKFGEVFDTQMTALESVFPESEFADLKVEYEQRLLAVLGEYMLVNGSNATRTRLWLEEAEFLDSSLRDTFFVQLAYQQAVTLYEDAVESNLGYDTAVEALQAFIDDYSEHPLADDAGTLLTEANASLERVEVQDDGKITMFYQNGTPYEVELIFEWNHSDGIFLDKETVKLPPCEACTEASGCIASSPIEEIRLAPQDYVYSLFVAQSGVMPTGGPITIEEPGFVCISLTRDWMSQSGLFD